MCRKLTAVTFILSVFLLPAFVAYGDTTLMDAAKRGSYKAVEELLKSGADVNAKDEYGATALMYAAFYSGNTETVELLLKHGANVNAKDTDNGTALMSAASGGKTEIAKLLLQHGANVNAKDKFGATALMYAAMEGHQPELVNILIEAGANVNTRDRDGGTALMRGAGSFGDDRSNNDDNASGIVSALLKAGAHVNLKMTGGVTKGWNALMFAEFAGNTKTISILRKAGASGKLTPKQREEYDKYIRD